MSHYAASLQEASLAKMNAKEYKIALELTWQSLHIMSCEAMDPTEYIRSLFSQVTTTLIGLVYAQNTAKVTRILSELQNTVKNLEPDVKIQGFSSILNEVARAYLTTGDRPSAKKHLTKAFALCREQPLRSGVQAELYLDFCTTLSIATEHKQALFFAKKACICAQEELTSTIVEGTQPGQVTLVAVAYYNLGVEEEYLGKTNNAQKCYQKTYSLLTKQNTGNEELLREVVAALRELKGRRRTHSAKLAANRRGGARHKGASEKPPLRSLEEKLLLTIPMSLFMNEYDLKSEPVSRQRVESSKGNANRFPRLESSHCRASGAPYASPSRRTFFARSTITSFPIPSPSTKSKSEQIQDPLGGNQIRNTTRKPVEELVYKGKTNIEGVGYQVTVRERTGTAVIMIRNNTQKYKLVTGKQDNYSEYLGRLTIHDNKLLVKTPELGLRKIQQQTSELGNEQHVVEYFVDPLYSVLVIKAENIATKSVLYSSDPQLSVASESELILFIGRCVHPFLVLADGSLAVDRGVLLSRTLSRANSRISIYKIHYQGSLQILIEVDDGAALLKQHFSVAEIGQFLGLVDENEFFDDPHVLNMGISIAGSSIELEKPDSASLVPKFLATKVVGSCKYQIKIYRRTAPNEDSFFVSACGPNLPLIHPLFILEDSIPQALNLRDSSDRYSLILDVLVVVNQELAISPDIKRKTLEEHGKLLKTVISVQRLYRKRAARQRAFLLNEQQKRKSVKRLLCRSGKNLNDHFYLLSIYKTLHSITIEALSQENSSFLTKTVPNPSDSIVTDSPTSIADLLNKIEVAEGQLRITHKIPFPIESNGSGPKPLLPRHSEDQTFNRIIIGQEYSISIAQPTEHELQLTLNPSLHGDTLLTTLSSEEIHSKLGEFDVEKLLDHINIKGNQVILEAFDNSTKKARQKQQGKTREIEPIVLLRTSIAQHGRICMIIMKILAVNPEEYSYSDLLVFQARQGANIQDKREIDISLAKACKSTGFDKDQLIPMGSFIIKRMLVVTPEALTFDFSAPQFNPTVYIIKLQAHIRGFLGRKRLGIKRELLFKQKTKISGEKFTLLVYQESKRVAVEVFNKGILLVAYLRSDIFEGVDSIERYIKTLLIPSLYIGTSGDKRVLKGLERLGFPNEPTLKRSSTLIDRDEVPNKEFHQKSTLIPPRVFKAFNRELVLETTKVIRNIEWSARVLKRAGNYIVKAASDGYLSILCFPMKLVDSASALLALLQLPEGQKMLYPSANGTFELISSEKQYIAQREALTITFGTELGRFLSVSFLKHPVSFTTHITEDDSVVDFRLTQEQESDCFS